MYPQVSASIDELLPFQCTAYRKGQEFPALVSSDTAPSAAAKSPGPQPAVVAPEPDFLKWLSAIWPEGNVPVQRINQLSNEQIEQVRSFIRNKQYDYWPNAPWVIALRGSPGETSLFRTILEDKNSKDLRVIFAKKVTAVALGAYVNRTHDTQAEDLLTTLSDPAHAKQFVEQSRTPDYDAVGLALAAGKGGALSGTDAGQAVISGQRDIQRTNAVMRRVSPQHFEYLQGLKDAVQQKGLNSVLEGSSQ